MKKDIAWLKEEIGNFVEPYDTRDLLTYRAGVVDMAEHVLHLINQLDEPEILSQEWIDEHVVYPDVSGRPREISISYNSDEKYFPAPDISISSTGDGVAGAEMCLEFTGEVWEEELEKESERRLIAEEYAQSNNLSIVSNEFLKDLRNDSQKVVRYETATFLDRLVYLFTKERIN